MTFRFQVPSRQAGPADLHRARQRDALVRSELPRVRAAALAWRNGLAALLTGLVGFGLVKGRSDLADLAHSFAVAVGVLLLAALAVGTAGAWWLMSAAHGLPSITPATRLGSRTASDHHEAVRAASQLRRGIAATLGCTAILVTAVGITWYGPGSGPTVQVRTPTGVQCGSLLELGPNGAVLTTVHGQVTYEPGEPASVRIDRSDCSDTP